MKTNIDNNITKLVNTKNQSEYSKIYEPLQKDWQAYQSAKSIVNRSIILYFGIYLHSICYSIKYGYG